CNQIIALPADIAMLTANLPSGYHRDLQLLKEQLFPAIQHLKSCLSMMHLMLSNIEGKAGILEAERYQFLFSVEEVNKLVLAGVPFRDAYKQIGQAIENGEFVYSTALNHTHEGSIGNLQTAAISAMMDRVMGSFQFEKWEEAVGDLRM
ncbi:MAG: argininosuccinate lyase, partial [Saprospiraceae bacterium]|nr:argininosuccinate lyase [Saprospiraceae bacterium]